MRTKIIPIFAFALLATACSDGGDMIGTDPNKDTKNEILVGTKVTTRASVESDGDGILTLPTSLEVAFLRAANATAANWTLATATAQTETGTGPGIIYATLDATTAVLGSNTILFDDAQYYHGSPTMKSFLKGYYPETATLTKASAAPENVTATWTIDGATDLMVSNYLEGTKANAGVAIPLEFRHLLSKITIKIVAENAAAAAGWGNVSSVVINNQPTKITHTFDGVSANAYASAIAATPDEQPITIRKVTAGQITDAAADPLAITATSTSFGQAMVYPAATYSITVATTLGGTPAAINATIDGSGAQAGMNHVITLTFKAGVITATTTVKQWEDSSDSGAIDVE